MNAIKYYGVFRDNDIMPITAFTVKHDAEEYASHHREVIIRYQDIEKMVLGGEK